MGTFDAAKLRELVLYIARRCESRPRFSPTALNKLLFSSDFRAYRELGRPITSCRYLAERSGPVLMSDARQIVQEEMVSAGEIAVSHTGGDVRFIALRDANLMRFSADEIAVVERVIKVYTAGDRESDCANPPPEVLAWLAGRAEHLATGRAVAIPYGAAFLTSPVLDEFEQAHALDLARKHRWPV